MNSRNFTISQRSIDLKTHPPAYVEKIIVTMTSYSVMRFQDLNKIRFVFTLIIRRYINNLCSKLDDTIFSYGVHSTSSFDLDDEFARTEF